MLPSAVNNSYKCRGNFLKTILEIEKHNEKFRDNFCIKNDISCSFFCCSPSAQNSRPIYMQNCA